MKKSDAPIVGPARSGAVMVVGAGIGGMQSALDLADAGFLVHLVERDISIGGVMAQLDKTFPTNDCSTCMLSPKLLEVAANPNIRIHSRTEVLDLQGRPGDFKVRVRQAPRFIDPAVCSGCGDCVSVCPVELPANFNEGLDRRKAIYRHFPQAVPSAYAIDKSGPSPCKTACPAGVSAQGYVALIAQGRFREALAVVRRDNPLPAVCGRVCTHPCESQCRRGLVDEPVAIRDLKKFIADWEMEIGDLARPDVKPRREEKVAVVGSGPAGLTAAYYLALEGFRPTVFEALPAAGGMLRTGIPDYRLPPKILDYEIDYIRAVGVDIRLNTPIGPNLSLSDLRGQGFQAVFLAVGAHHGRSLNVEGQDLAGVRSGVTFLRDAALVRLECPGERIAVIGGGNVAVDAARTARRSGSREVTILYRRTRREMPAYEEEIEEALEEGIRIEFLAAPKRLIAREGRVTGVELLRMELGEPDRSGRRRPRPVPGSEYVLPVDGVVNAIGQTPELDFLTPGDGLEIASGDRLDADPLTLQTRVPWIFAGGDAVTGPADVVQAIAAGKTAAESIRRWIEGEDLGAGRNERPAPAEGDATGAVPAPRHRPPSAAAETRIGNFDEVVGRFDPETAKAEAARCLACGICSECYQCLEVCRAGAIRHDAAPRELDIPVGAVILAPGFRPFDARLKPEYGYGRLPNVITSLEFERLNSASGPTGGRLQRLSDGREPEKIAWIQCVGSRDPAAGRDYCSYVCCMSATKQAVIAQEHAPGLTAAIFYMDIRAQGKGFDRYYERARARPGLRYVRSMISRVIEDPATHDLEIQYYDESDRWIVENFDLVVLSVGLAPHPEAQALAQALGVDTDRFGFAARTGLNPLTTSRPGVFACGVFQAPRDIPDTVIQAGGAAAEAAALLAEARGTAVTIPEIPEERDTRGEPPRIGVFVCHCGVNIGGVVDVPAVADYARGLPHVVYTQACLFTCSTDTQAGLMDAIREHRLNRVVVASCSPRTHEPLFQETLRQAGLNPYLFEMANIRDQCSWVHADQPAAATNKSRDLVRMAVARAARLEPVHRFPAPVEQSALVIGGGLAGLTAALSLADQGFFTYMVEKTGRLGGLADRLRRNLEGLDVRAYLDDLREKVRQNDRIEVHLNTELQETSGRVGWFTSRLDENGREIEIHHGAAILATGASEYQPEEYFFGQDDRVLTQLTLHELLSGPNDPLAGVRDVVMIQCVGSREADHPYCSRICCAQAVSNARSIKELRPDIDVTVLFRDMRTYALKELSYRQVRELGVRFIRFEPDQAPEVTPESDGLTIRVFDHTLGEEILLRADRLVLSAAVRPHPDARALASRLKLPLDADGFFMEAHLKLRPVDFVSAGFFLAGAAHGPKFLEESIAQAKAAAARAAIILSRRELTAGGEVAIVDQEHCVACLTCVRTCPFGVPRIDENHFAYIDPAACQGCGSCAAACPRRAIQIGHHTDEQIMSKLAVI